MDLPTAVFRMHLCLQLFSFPRVNAHFLKSRLLLLLYCFGSILLTSSSTENQGAKLRSLNNPNRSFQFSFPYSRVRTRTQFQSWRIWSLPILFYFQTFWLQAASYESSNRSFSAANPSPTLPTKATDRTRTLQHAELQTEMYYRAGPLELLLYRP